MRIVFMGTPEFAVPTLTELVARGHDVCACYTRPPRPAGRGLSETRSPVHEAAEGFGIEVRLPASLKSEDEQARFADLGADVGVVVAYALILPPAILAAPSLGCLNLHASLLPRWRGAAPIQRAVMAGDARTGLAVMKMDAGLDTGPVGLVEEVPIGPDMTAGELHDTMMRRGADLMARALAALERSVLDFTPQPDQGVTYAAKISNQETRIDWSRPAGEVHNLIRGLSPAPGAWFEAAIGGKSARIKALRSERTKQGGPAGKVVAPPLTVACGTGAVRLVEVQRAGRAVMDADAFVRGAGDMVGTVLA